MKCPSPLSIKDPSGIGASQRLTVPCGRCGACRHNRRSDWSFRLKEELRKSKNAFFITLTYSDDTIPISDSGLPTLDKTDLQKFIKRLRKRNTEKGYQLRYYSVGEYGTLTGRPHYHIVGYNIHPDLASVRFITIDTWYHGHTYIGDVTPASIHYVTKYHTNVKTSKQEWLDPETGEIFSREKEFATMSRKPGLGKGYLDRATEYHRANDAKFVINDGYKQRLPRYYDEKIFDPLTRQRQKKQSELNADIAYAREYDRLVSKGIERVDSYMLQSQYLSARKVVDKNEIKDLF